MPMHTDGSGGLGVPPDFDHDRLRGGLPALFMDPIHRSHLDLVESTFRSNHPDRIPPDPEPRIPKITHQIWIGGPLPETYRHFRDGWVERHPDWDHRLWTDARIAELDFPERDLYDAAWNASMKANILRAVLVHRFGGLYLDVDYECLRPLDPFHHRYDFYAAFRGHLGPHCTAPWIYPHPFLVCSSLFAARPGHPVPAAYLRKVRRLWPLLRYAGKGGRGLPAYYDGPRPHTFAVHHSEASWL